MNRPIYNLKSDTRRIQMIQKASLDKNSYAGYKTENGLLFGTEEWFDSIENGILKKCIIEGVISSVFMSGHGDYPEFEIESNGIKTVWTREGFDEVYKIGKSVQLIYVEQKYKRPTDVTGVISKCVIEINITE